MEVRKSTSWTGMGKPPGIEQEYVTFAKDTNLAEDY